ncbi:response regulator transcription factor [Paenibacillus fonticola]|uniref:response regulator transcription factor n=1 Tax=Paenibacillus fonticola TaxID=379896 RepID=UPI0003745BA4|nr:response regulator [Paenibacillus fonticola]
MMKVMIVDDELLMRIGLKSMLNWEEHGFQIIGEAANGKEALLMIRQQPPDLIITDIKMPVMDGLELIRQASQMLNHCQYVILSCLDEFHYAKEALRLGAADYLIKGDIKMQMLLEVLETVKQRSSRASSAWQEASELSELKESVSYLKEKLFKELFSGFLNEEELLHRCETFRVNLVQAPLILLKMKVERFEDLRRKYVEQDEKLLRYSIVNILEELLPRKWYKEIVTLNSAEYVIVMNIHGEDADKFALDLGRMLDRIMIAMKDFLNIGLYIGVSGQVNEFFDLKKAYMEADAALKQLFYEEASRVHYYASGIAAASKSSFRLSRGEEQQLRDLVEKGGEESKQYLSLLKQRLKQEGVSEEGIRKAYLHLLSLITTCFPGTPEWWSEGRTPYEQLLLEEKLEGMHLLIVQFMEQCIEHNRMPGRGAHSYADQVCTIIRNQYAEDISLQTVSRQINVNASYLSRVFKQETGVNFVAYLTRVRIEKAQQLLREGGYKVYEVADQVGYRNTAYFSKIFKKIVGVSPEEFGAKL